MITLEKKDHHSEQNMGGGCLQMRSALAEVRIKCNFPIHIKGINQNGEHYDEIALVENLSRRGLCIRTYQPLMPGTIFIMNNSVNDQNAIGIFQVIWTKSIGDNLKLMGAQLLGDDYSWWKFLSDDVVILTAPNLIRTSMANVA